MLLGGDGAGRLAPPTLQRSAEAQLWDPGRVTELPTTHLSLVGWAPPCQSGLWEQTFSLTQENSLCVWFTD